MSRIEEVFRQFDLKEFLHSTLAPHGFGNAEDSIFLGCTSGLPFLDQARVQFFKFSRIFPRNYRSLGEYSVFLCVRVFPLLITHECNSQFGFVFQIRFSRENRRRASGHSPAQGGENRRRENENRNSPPETRQKDISSGPICPRRSISSNTALSSLPSASSHSSRRPSKETNSFGCFTASASK